MNTKKITIVFAALAAFVLVFTYCADMEFNNPLDKKGDNYLYGWDKEPTWRSEYETMLLDKDGFGNAGLFANRDFVCDPTVPNVSLRSFPDPIGVNQTGIIDNIMGRNGMAGNVGPLVLAPGEQVERNWSADNSVRLFPTDAFGNKIEIEIPYNPDPNVMFSTVPGRYVIEYTARRDSIRVAGGNACQIGTSGEITLTRIINIESGGQIDMTSPPVIELAGGSVVSLNLNDNYQENGLNAVQEPATLGGGSITTLDSIVIRSGAIGTTPSVLEASSILSHPRGITVLEAAEWVSSMFNGVNLHRTEHDVSITYHVTSPTNGVRASITRTVEVRDVITTLPAIQIVLEKKARTYFVDGQFMQLRTLTDQVSGTAPYVSAGVADAFYLDRITRDTVRTNPLTGVLLRQEVTHTQPSGGEGRRPVLYSHGGVQGEAERATEERVVYVTDTECETSAPPIITATPSPLTIPAGTPWQPDIGQAPGPYWTLERQDWFEQPISPAPPSYRFETVLDHHAPFSVLNARNPQPGTYTVYHIGLGYCGGFSVVSRQVIVQ